MNKTTIEEKNKIIAPIPYMHRVLYIVVIVAICIQNTTQIISSVAFIN